LVPWTSENLIEGGTALVEHNIELIRRLIEHTESSNIRIRKLNALRHKRRFSGLVDEEVSSDEEEEPIPSISSYLTNPIMSQPNPTILLSNGNQQDDAEMVEDPIPNKTITRTEPSGNNWALMIANGSGIQSNLPKDGYVDYSDVGLTFKESEAMKNTHELDLTAIPNTLRQMAHFRVYIPLSMLTTDALKKIRDNVGDLYTKKKTSLSA